MKQAEAGKGSRPRPFNIKQEEWSDRWDAIFARNNKKDLGNHIEVTAEEEEAFKDLEKRSK